MKIYIVLGHQNLGSFNHAIVETAIAQLQADGHEVIFHDLYQEKFDPILHQDEITGAAPLDPIIQKHIDELLAADGIMVVHPNWWGQPPAILRGWQDRVLKQGQVYKFGPNGPEGKLKSKRVLVITTSNTPREDELRLFGDPLENLWKNCAFGLCGVDAADFCRRNFESIIMSTPEQRKAWLDEVVALVKRQFPAAD